MNCPAGSKLIKLTKGKYAIVDEGFFYPLSKFSWYAQTSGSTNIGLLALVVGVAWLAAEKGEDACGEE